MFFGNAVYSCRINEGNGVRDINLDYHKMPSVYQSTEDYHEMIVLNGKTALRRTKNPRYFESVGGIYLGMDKNQVVSKYGQPSSVQNSGRYSTWKYNREGFELAFEYNVVKTIKIYPYGDRKFDWSGLSASSSVSNFEYKYNNSVTRRGNLEIGRGEFITIRKIRFNEDSVWLDTRTGLIAF